VALRSEVSIICWPPLIPIFKKKVGQNRMTLSIFMSKNVFGVCLECFSLDGSLGLQVCPKKFFSSAIYSPLIALCHTQNNKSKEIFPTFPLFVKNLKKITLKSIEL
jgi:hypothetical protein